jgi:hypothetical protein
MTTSTECWWLVAAAIIDAGWVQGQLAVGRGTGPLLQWTSVSLRSTEGAVPAGALLASRVSGEQDRCCAGHVAQRPRPYRQSGSATTRGDGVYMEVGPPVCWKLTTARASVRCVCFAGIRSTRNAPLAVRDLAFQTLYNSPPLFVLQTY